MKAFVALIPTLACLASASPLFFANGTLDVDATVELSQSSGKENVSFEHLGGNTTTPGVDSLPTCAIPCIQIAVKSASNCELTDLSCLCKHRAKIAHSAKSCIVSTCGAKTALKKVKPQVQALCKEEDAKEKQRLKEQKEREKAQEKARKEAEKQQKEKDKKQREDDKEREREMRKKKKLADDEEKRKKKEADKKKKDQEKAEEKYRKQLEKERKNGNAPAEKAPEKAPEKRQLMTVDPDVPRQEGDGPVV